jgi:uracil-DNA glycosylase
MPEVKLMLVGEAYGEEEERRGQPFVGPSGHLLNGLLAQAGIPRKECYLTNVFNLRPKPRNDVKNLCGPKAEGIPGRRALTQGKYVLARYAPEIERLEREIAQVKPNLVVALGGTAAWALLDTSGIRDIRGATTWSIRTGTKILPTYHPAAILREWSLRPITLMDLMKAKEECEFPEVKRPEREVWIEPTLDDCWRFFDLHIRGCEHLSIDIETMGDQITCIAFAPSPSLSLVVPFFDERKPGKNYWPTLQEELKAWDFVRICCTLAKKIVGQNFNYDMSFLWRSVGIPVPNAEDDTMLLHHALQPELQKGLGFLGSMYTNEAAWKVHHKNATRKRED